MGDEPFNKQQTTSSQKSGHSTTPRHLEYATERAKLLFGSYRRTDAADPDIYVAAIARVLSSYDASLIREVTDPLTGIATTEKHAAFMPNAGELKRYCEDMAARKARLDRLGSLPVPKRTELFLPAPEPRPGDLANVFVPNTNSRYQQLVDWTKTADADPRRWRFDLTRAGIWVSWDIWDGRHEARRPREPEQPRSMQLSDVTRKAMGLLHDEPQPHAEDR